jgi:hypothetical protein
MRGRADVGLRSVFEYLRARHDAVMMLISELCGTDLGAVVIIYICTYM